jgi:hypothetical protein
VWGGCCVLFVVCCVLCVVCCVLCVVCCVLCVVVLGFSAINSMSVSQNKLQVFFLNDYPIDGILPAKVKDYSNFFELYKNI